MNWVVCSCGVFSFWRELPNLSIIPPHSRWPRGRFLRTFYLAALLFAALPLAATEPETKPPAEPAPAATLLDTQKIFSGGVPKSLADLKAMEEVQRQLVDKVLASTVNVRLGSAQGSGVITSADGYVLTAAHVAHQPNVQVTVVMPDGRALRGLTLGLFRTVDAGLIKIMDDGPWPFVEMGDSAEVRVGQWCLAMGHPGGFEKDRKPVVRLGRVLAKNDSVVVTDCALVGGDSGGPLFDMQGRVIGVHSRIGQALNENLHVPVNQYRSSWERLAKAEVWGHLPGQKPYLGLQGDPESKVAKIAQVFNDTPAQKAGIKVGDVVTKVNGREIDTFDALTRLVQERQPGDKMKLHVMRGEENIELELEIGKK